MNDRQHPYDPYDPYAQQPEIIGYDAYGQPVYQQAQQYDAQQYDAPQQQGYGYDPYAQQPPYDPYAQQQEQQQQYGYVDTAQQQWIPQQAAPAPGPAPVAEPAHVPDPEPEPEPQVASVPQQRRPTPEYATEQFSFVEEPDENSEDVIDWLKFTESRTERREEARRRGRNRVVALVAAVALVVAGGVGYLWYAGMLPGLSGKQDTPPAAAGGPQKRDVIVVHLHTREGATSTALLVDNVTTKQGTTVLLPNSLAVAGDDGTTTTLGKSVDDDGSAGTREALGSVLGTRIGGSWRLDTPYLENLVELVGNVEVDTDTDVPDSKKGASPVVRQGKGQTLSGRMAVAYATYRAPGEAEAEQLRRFGQVMQGVLKKISDDPQAATTTVRSLAQILDPSLPEKDLGASLAKLAGHAKAGDHRTAQLPVQPDGTLSDSDAESVVKDILGGSVSSPEQGAAVRVGVRNAQGTTGATETARIDLVNGGYAFVDAGKAASVVTSSQVSYGDAAKRATAEEVAKTLGLPAGAVRKGKAAANADVTVVLGQDFKVE
ncbi:LCP family protein [Streptomyces altiplanensis]